jgi:hypothetical protein
MMALADAQRNMADAQRNMADAQGHLAEAQRQTEANLSALTSIVADTERRLNSLAALVERFISEGRNGKP